MFNVSIRPLVKKDAHTSFQWRNDPDIWSFTGSRPDAKITEDKEIEWIEKALLDNSCRRFAILCDGKYIGNIQLTDLTVSDAQYHIFIGDKNYWGKGIAQLATFQILHYAWEELKLERIYLSVNELNIAAIRTYLKSSFEKISEDAGSLKMICNLSKLQVPTVSVFVMVYNHENYLNECLDGILTQKCNFNFNIIVGEDYSTDNSRKILDVYQKKHPGKFKLLLHNKNIGAVKNQTSVFRNCTGRYIAMCEGDDYWTNPHKLQKQVDFLEANQDYVLTFHPIQILKTDGVLVEDFITKVPENYEHQETLASGNNYIHTPSVVFRNIITSFPPEFMLSPIGDYFLYMILTNHGKMKMINDTMAVYRIGVGIHSVLNDAQKNIDWRKTNTLIMSSISNFQIKTILFKKLFPTLSVEPIVETKKKSRFTDAIKLFIPPVILIIKNKIYNHK